MKTTLKLTLLVFVTILSISCNNKQQTKTTVNLGKRSIITPTEFKEKSVNQTIVDIRTSREFNQGHIEGAVNINYFDKNFIEQISKLDKDKPIFIYCRSGNRTSSASRKILNLGFKQVYDLQGGILNWTRNNNPIVK